MKLLHYINLVIYVCTVIPYITIYYAMIGMYMQFLLGIVQLLIAIVLLFFTNSFDSKTQKLLGSYWFFTLAIIASITYVYNRDMIQNDMVQIVTLYVIPMIIATHFLRITYLIQKK